MSATRRYYADPPSGLSVGRDIVASTCVCRDELVLALLYGKDPFHVFALTAIRPRSSSTLTTVDSYSGRRDWPSAPCCALVSSVPRLADVPAVCWLPSQARIMTVPAKVVEVRQTLEQSHASDCQASVNVWEIHRHLTKLS